MRPIGQEPPLNADPVSSHSAWSSMRTGIFSTQGLREILVAATTSSLAKPIDRNGISLTCIPGYAARTPRNPANMLSISR